MPRFAANLSMLFTELPFMARFEAAAKAGFGAVEFRFPYPFDKNELAAALRHNGQLLVQHNLPAGNWAAGDRGIACHPDRVSEFRLGVARGIDYATALGCPQLNCLAGKLPAGADAYTMQQVLPTLVTNLRYAARALEAAGLQLLIEPVNNVDVPGFYLTRSDQALALMEQVDETNLKLQYDVYHAQRMQGELGGTLGQHIARIGHIQVADNPGRAEPGTGEINYQWLFEHIDALRYRGWIGCEYRPRDGTVEGLAWRQALTVCRPPAPPIGLRI